MSIASNVIEENNRLTTARALLREKLTLNNVHWENSDTIFELIARWANTDDDLMIEYIATVHYEGGHFSEDLLKKYISRKLFGLKKRREKMLSFIDFINKFGSEKEVFGSWKEIHNTEEHFKKIKISPVVVNRRTPYIPSFYDLITDQVDNEQLGFATRECRSRNVVLW